MEISISTKHGSLPEDLQQSIRDKVARLPRFFDRMSGIDVIVDLEKPENPEVELRVSAAGSPDFFAADHGSNVLVALDRVLQKLEQQLRKQKEKLTGHRGRSGRQLDAND